MRLRLKKGEPMTEVKCPDCDVAMEAGFVPDDSFMDNIKRSVWSRGEPSKRWLAPQFINAPSMTTPITTFRCPECGLLREYAFGK